MADVFTKEKRSHVMSLIKSKGNKNTELRLISIFRAHRITGWRRNFPLLGKPDFVFPRERVAVFVDGCFWHGCPRHGRYPGSNREYWIPKLRRNRQRDSHIKRVLSKSGWNVIRFWEHALDNPEKIIQTIVRKFDFSASRLPARRK